MKNDAQPNDQQKKINLNDYRAQMKNKYASVASDTSIPLEPLETLPKNDQRFLLLALFH